MTAPKQLSAEEFQELIEDYPATEGMFTWLNQLAQDVRGESAGLPEMALVDAEVTVPPGDSGASCAARYTTVTAGSYATGSDTVLNFNVKDYDTDGAVAAGSAWKFTVPAGKAGYYSVSVGLAIASYTQAAAQQHAVRVFKKGVGVARIATFFTQAAPTTLVGLSGSDVYYLAEGDYIDLRYFQNTGNARALHTTAGFNHVSIHRVPGPVPDVTLSTAVKKKISGATKAVLVGRAVKVGSTDKVVPPRIAWEEDGQVIRLRSVSGLPPNGKYKLTLVVVGGG